MFARSQSSGILQNPYSLIINCSVKSQNAHVGTECKGIPINSEIEGIPINSEIEVYWA